MKKNGYLFILICAFCSCIPQLVLADDAETEAKEAFIKGTQHFSDGEYVLASEAFREAYKFKPTWKLLFNIGQAEAAAKRYGLALDAMETYMAKGGDDVKQTRLEQVMAEITRLRLLVGMLEVEAPAGSVVMIDDFERATLPSSRPIRIAVGTHVVQIIIDGRVAHEETIEIAGNLTTTVRNVNAATLGEEFNLNNGANQQADKNHLSRDHVDGNEKAESDPQKRDKILLIGGITAGALGIGGLTMGTIGAIKYSKDADVWDKAEAAYDPLSGLPADFNAAKRAHSDLQADSNLMKVGFIIGGVFTVTSIVLFVLRKKKKSPVAFKPSMGNILLTF